MFIGVRTLPLDGHVVQVSLGWMFPPLAPLTPALCTPPSATPPMHSNRRMHRQAGRNCTARVRSASGPRPFLRILSCGPRPVPFLPGQSRGIEAMEWCSARCQWSQSVRGADVVSASRVRARTRRSNRSSVRAGCRWELCGAPL
eukprot:gene11019-biopygen13895